MKKLEEKDLLSSCIKKTRNGQRQLFDFYYRRTYHLAMRYVANHHDTEDVLINAFSRVFKKIDQFEWRGEGSLYKWIKTIVINESIRFLNQTRILKYHDDLNYLNFKNSWDAEVDIIDVEEVYQILEVMPAGYRTVFNLYAIEGYSHKEVAEMLRISESTSKSQLFKARNYIIDKLDKKEKYGIG